MKSLRKSRNTENRNARMEMAIRGRASRSRSALFDPDVVLSGRRFRRANRLTHIQAEMLNVMVRRPDGSAILPTVAVEPDESIRMGTGLRMKP